VENVPNGVSNQSLFFLNIDRLKKARIITHISYDKYKVKNLCVSASSGDTLLEALERDGRFIKPENWTLIRGDNLSKVPVETKANCCEKYFFDVEFKIRKRTSSGVSESGAVEIKKEKIGEDEVNDVSSPSPMSAKRASPVNSFHKKILESAQSHAKKLLAENKRRKLATLIETKFSKLIDQSKSVWLMQELVSASKCVGRINAESGRVAGTCFLVTEDVILTNYHVYKDINDDAASRQDNPKVKVSFNHMWPNQTLNLGEVEVDMKDIRAQCQDESLDYIFLGLKNKGGQPGLSGKISLVDQNNFTNEVVTIIGHPDGREKLIDPDCRIISQHTWRPELLERIQKRQPFEFNPLFTCKEAIMSDKYKQKIAYDTTFFDCSSGSPVFDDQGKVIAMHTCGWVEKREEIKCSVMEFAIPMEAIYNHCYNNFPQVVALLFPSFSMNVDEQD
jgi:V8-like Glu-specific endopeptidase